MSKNAVNELEEKEVKEIFRRKVFMDYPVCPLCSSPLIPLHGSKWIAFVVCSNDKKCGRIWDKYELLGAYVSGGGKYIAQEIIEKWWKELIEIMKKQNQNKKEE